MWLKIKNKLGDRDIRESIFHLKKLLESVEDFNSALSNDFQDEDLKDDMKFRLTMIIIALAEHFPWKDANFNFHFLQPELPSNKKSFLRKIYTYIKSIFYR